MTDIAGIETFFDADPEKLAAVQGSNDVFQAKQHRDSNCSPQGGYTPFREYLTRKFATIH